MRIELESRLVELVTNIDSLCRAADNSFLAQHLVSQILRSSSSAALNYGESLAAESKRDFIHKTSVALKELRETKINLKLLKSKLKHEAGDHYTFCFAECDQLIAIFYQSLKTSRGKQ